MKILSLNYLRENVNTTQLARDFGLNVNDVKTSIQTNQEYGNNLKKISTVNQFRGFNFEFYEKNGFDPNNITEGNDEIFETFANIYIDEVAFFYPYYNNRIIVNQPEEIKSYFNLQLYRPEDGVQILPNNFFKGFDSNDLNYFDFSLNIGQNFDKINKNIIENGGTVKPEIAELKKYDSSNQINNDYYIHFKHVTQAKLINPQYDALKKSRYIIDLSVSNPNPNNVNPTLTNLIATFNSEFSHTNPHTYSVHSVVNRNFVTNVLTRQGSTFVVRLPKSITELKNVSGPIRYNSVECSIGRNTLSMEPVNIEITKVEPFKS